MTSSAPIVASSAAAPSSSPKAQREARVREAGVALADRVLAQAQAAREAERAGRASTRSGRRRARAQHVSLAPVTARDLDVDIVERRVDDPWPDPARTDPLGPKPQVRVAVNRRVDILEQELANKRIDEAEYRVGRLVQAVFERAMGRVGGGGWSQGDRVDAALAHELAVLHGLETGEKVRALERGSCGRSALCRPGSCDVS